MEAFSTNVCFGGFLFILFSSCSGVFWLFFSFDFFGGVVFGVFFIHFQAVFSAIFLELLNVCGPQIAFYTCQPEDAISSALACLSDMMPMLLESGLG